MEKQEASLWKDSSGGKRLNNYLTPIALLVIGIIATIIFSYSTGVVLYPFLHPMYLTFLILIFASAVYIAINKMKQKTVEGISNSTLSGESNLMILGAVIIGILTQLFLYILGLHTLDLVMIVFQIMFFVMISAMVFFYVMMFKLISYSTLSNPSSLTSECIQLGAEKIYPVTPIGFRPFITRDKEIKWKDVKKVSLIQEKGHSLDDFIGFRLKNPYIEIVPKKGDVVKARITDVKGFISAMSKLDKIQFEEKAVSAESVGLVLLQQRIRLGNAYLTTGITLIMAYMFVMHEFIFLHSKQPLDMYFTIMPYALIPYLIIIIFGLFYLKFRREMKPEYHEYQATK